MENFQQKSPLSPKRPTKNFYEYEAWSHGKLVCGVDEVGRGCLAGPVVTAAVILHPNKRSTLIKDSKLLSQEELIKGAAWVIKNSWYGYGILSHTHIDAHNIYQATMLAMRRAVAQALFTCPQPPTTVLVDAMPLKLNSPHFSNITIRNFIKGESLSISIAAASIIAKVKRDLIISRFDNALPGYLFGEHKGYATDYHCNAVRKLGRTIIHRNSFLSNVLKREGNHGTQTNLF